MNSWEDDIKYTYVVVLGVMRKMIEQGQTIVPVMFKEIIDKRFESIEDLTTTYNELKKEYEDVFEDSFDTEYEKWKKSYSIFKDVMIKRINRQADESLGNIEKMYEDYVEYEKIKKSYNINKEEMKDMEKVMELESKWTPTEEELEEIRLELENETLERMAAYTLKK